MDIKVKEEEITIDDDTNHFFTKEEAMITSYEEPPVLRTDIENATQAGMHYNVENDFSYLTSPVAPRNNTEPYPVVMPDLVTVVKNEKGETVVQKFVDPLDEPNSHTKLPLANTSKSRFEKSKNHSTRFYVNKRNRTQTCLCCVCKLARRGPAAFSDDEKNSLIRSGRPTPELTHISTFSVSFTQPHLYNSYTWLTACKKTNQLYCWPCLLFHPVEKSIFLHQEFTRYQGIQNVLKKHATLEAHSQAYMKERVLANRLAKTDTNIDIKKYNSLVGKSKNVLKRLMNIMLFHAMYDVKRRGSINQKDKKTVLMDLIKLVSVYDETLLQEIEDIPNFQENLLQIYKDLETCLVDITLQEIRNELKNASFVSFIFYNVTDNNKGKNHLSTIVRFIKYVNGKPVTQERYLGYIDIDPCERTVETMVEIITNLILSLDCKEKIVSQSYCGSSILPNELGVLQMRIKGTYSTALSTYCFGFNICEVLEQSLSMEIDICRQFFSELRGITELFLKNPKLDELLQTTLSSDTLVTLPVSWEFNGQLLKKISNALPYILHVFRRVIIESDSWNPETINACRGYVVLLETNKKFSTLVKVFAEIFEPVDDLLCTIRTKPFEVDDVACSINETLRELVKMKSNFLMFINETNSTLTMHSAFKDLYFQIFDNICNQLRNQLKNYNDLKFLESCNFKENAKKLAALTLPKVLLITKNYQSIFDKDALYGQYQTLLSSTDVDLNCTPEEMLSFLKSIRLDVGFSEVTKLIELVLTIPTVVGSNKNLVCNLENVRNYVINCPNERTAWLAIEKDLFQNLAKNPKFWDDVFDQFVTVNDNVKLHFLK